MYKTNELLSSEKNKYVLSSRRSRYTSYYKNMKKSHKNLTINDLHIINNRNFILFN